MSQNGELSSRAITEGASEKSLVEWKLSGVIGERQHVLKRIALLLRRSHFVSLDRVSNGSSWMSNHVLLH
jgi:hypothetical protein